MHLPEITKSNEATELMAAVRKARLERRAMAAWIAQWQDVGFGSWLPGEFNGVRSPVRSHAVPLGPHSPTLPPRVSSCSCSGRRVFAEECLTGPYV